MSLPSPEVCLVKVIHRVYPGAKQAAHQDVQNKCMNEWAVVPSCVNQCGCLELWVLRASSRDFWKERAFGGGILPRQERMQAYGKELVGKEQNTITSLVLEGQLGAGKSHIDEPDQDPSPWGQPSAFTGT